MCCATILALHGPRFGCGLGQCGACTVHIDGEAVRSCVTPLSAVAAKQKVVTLEGLGSPEQPHPVQKAFIDEQAAQCGYCINGMIMESAAFLAKNKKPSEGDIKDALANNLCRCGTHARIVRRSSAPRLRRKGGSHEYSDLPPRRASRLRRPHRQLLACRPAPRSAGASRRQAGRAHRSRFLPRYRQGGNVTVYSGKVDLGTGVTHGAARRSWPRSSTCHSAASTLIQGDTLLTPDQGDDLGQRHHPARRHAAASAPGAARGALMAEAAKSLGADAS